MQRASEISARASLGPSTDKSPPASASAASAAGKRAVIGKRVPSTAACQPLISALGPMTACWLGTSTSYKWTLTQGFCVEKILPLEDKFVWLHCIQKGNSSNIHNVIKYLTIRLSGDNTATQMCTLCFLY